MFEKILFPTDFSEEAKTELSCITGIPGIREIILLHVIRLSVVPRGSAMVESLAVHTAEVYLQKAKTYIAHSTRISAWCLKKRRQMISPQQFLKKQKNIKST